MTDAIREALRALPHFQALDSELFERVVACAELRSFERAETIFLHGDKARAFFVVRCGSVRVYRATPDGREQVVHHLRAGQSFAEPAVLSIGRYPVNAIALESPTELVAVDARFLELLKGEPRLSIAIVSSLSMRLLGLVERIEELSIASAPARLAHYLMKLPAQGTHEHLVVQLPLAKKDLAAHLAIAPETLSRLLRRWQDRGLIRSKGRTLDLLDTRILLAIADRDE
ncbi:MAG: Crp/Fnr family transcriptional regulator [Planctomycetes bacterium]|nr:Crp/Fnr family transcriptional regulator [Planctomycetota bacterium]